MCVFLLGWSISLSAQDGCKLQDTYKHTHYEPIFASEHAGVYQNAHIVENGRVQIEINTILFTIVGEYTNPVNANILALRYGLNAKTEVQLHSGHLNPSEINTDSLYNTSIRIGLKRELIHYSRNRFQWKASVRAGGTISTSTQLTNPTKYPLGLDFSIDNSLSYHSLLHFDLSLGVYKVYKTESKLEGKLSSRILLKDEHSKVGLFMGIAGNQYFESIVNLGLQISNNKNYILLLSTGFLDKGVSPNVAFTFLF